MQSQQTDSGALGEIAAAGADDDDEAAVDGALGKVAAADAEDDDEAAVGALGAVAAAGSEIPCIHGLVRSGEPNNFRGWLN